MNLQEIKGRVECEIANYRYEYIDGLVGRPWSQEKINKHLKDLRSALVGPYVAEIARRDTPDEIRAQSPRTSQCVIVADDGQGTVLAFDETTGLFLLASKVDHGLVSFGVTGDAVGCFMAR